MQSKVDIKVSSKSRFSWTVIVVLTVALVALFTIAVFISLTADYCVINCQQPTPASSSTPELQKVQGEHDEEELIARCGGAIEDVESTATTPPPNATKSVADMNATSHSRKNSTAAKPTASTTNNVSLSRYRNPSRKTSTSPTNSAADLHTTGNSAQSFINITGKIYFEGKAPAGFPPNSHLMVDFADVSLADADAVFLGETTVDVSRYRKGKPLLYTITCKGPLLEYRSYDVSAVLNVGWKPTADEWIRLGDYFTDTSFPVHIKAEKTHYRRNIELVRANW